MSSVTVAPEYRGRGIGRLLMTALLDEIAVRGYPLSALFPATMPLYRSLGWELAGSRDTAVIPARSLLRLVPPDAVASPDVAAPDPRLPELRRAGPGDAEAVIALLGRVHETARDCGPVTWDTDSAADWLADPGLYAYLAEDGLLAYRWQRGNEELFVERAEAVSGQTVRALWTQLGSHALIADRVYAITGSASPTHLPIPLHCGSPGSATRTSRTGSGGCSGWSTRPRPSPRAGSPSRPRSASRCASPTTPAPPTPAAGS